MKGNNHMQVTKTADGKWRAGEVVFESNAEAWRYVDRAACEPVSSAEKRRKSKSERRRAERRFAKAKSKDARLLAKAAAKAPTWVRSIAAANFDPVGERGYRDSKLGTFGAASAVRRVDVQSYLDEKAGKKSA
jgi:hypothetical protein